MKKSNAPASKRLSTPLRACIASLCSFLLAAFTQGQDNTALDIASGKAIFEKSWVAAPASTTASDGLGPYYAARSCAACHPGGHPGAVPNSLVLMLSNDPVYGQELQPYAITGLPAEGKLQLRVPAPDAQGLSKPLYTLDNLQYGMLSKPGSLRRPPSLFGSAALDEVDPEILAALADPDDKNKDGISGRIGGRHGWKAESESVVAQIGKALSIDMGLSNVLYPSPHGDCTLEQTRCLEQPKGNSEGKYEVPATMIDLLATYIRSLAPPAPTAPADAEGQNLFTSFGCNACHVARLPANGRQLQIWSDLLLHDMGTGLAAEGGASEGAEPPASASEWRTAPLWGVGQRNRYLHDGRASTLTAAILWHDGEAEASRKRFEAAAKLQQERLLAFLRGL